MGHDLCSHLTDLIGAYFAWDITYAKQYQLLGFLQRELLQDIKTDYFHSIPSVKFLKRYETFTVRVKIYCC